MIKLSVRWFVLLVVIITISSSEAFRSRGYGSKSGNKVSAKQESALGTGVAQPPSPGIARRGLGISAWGLITLIISIILAMAGMYYFSICYPVLCKKTRKYDMIGVPTVA